MQARLVAKTCNPSKNLKQEDCVWRSALVTDNNSKERIKKHFEGV